MRQWKRLFKRESRFILSTGQKARSHAEQIHEPDDNADVVRGAATVRGEPRCRRRVFLYVVPETTCPVLRILFYLVTSGLAPPAALSVRGQMPASGVPEATRRIQESVLSGALSLLLGQGFPFRPVPAGRSLSVAPVFRTAPQPRPIDNSHPNHGA
jgi:hypothetical protein